MKCNSKWDIGFEHVYWFIEKVQGWTGQLLHTLCFEMLCAGGVGLETFL